MRQLSTWAEILQTHLVGFVVNLNGEKNEVFVNTKINREADIEFIKAICENLEHMNMGCWVFKDGHSSGGTFLVYKRKLEDWAMLFHEWAVRTGKINSIESTYSVINGEDSRSEPFHGIPDLLALKALRTLEAMGKCELSFRAPDVKDDIMSSGIKFFR